MTRRAALLAVAVLALAGAAPALAEPEIPCLAVGFGGPGGGGPLSPRDLCLLNR